MMHSITTPLTLLALTTSLITAQSINPTQSSPFSLILSSTNTTINGSTLSVCHEGAAIEGLCVTKTFPGPISPSTYTFNFTTSSGDYYDAFLGPQGFLIYELQGGNFNLSSPMVLQTSPETNVAAAFFEPADSGTSVGFDANGFLYILGDEAKAVYRWYSCLVKGSYSYTVLSWVSGSGEPDNASCVKVDVKRVFA